MRNGNVWCIRLETRDYAGEILLNLDSEDEGELYIGCAGGLDITATLEYKEETPMADFVARKITLKGLRGGHSGLEINEGRGNANNCWQRIVHDLLIEFDSQLASFEGGNMRNAIPREAHAVLVFNPEDMDGLEDYMKEYEAQLNDEYAPIEKWYYPEYRRGNSTHCRCSFRNPG